jgi:hypothetical protein
VSRSRSWPRRRKAPGDAGERRTTPHKTPHRNLFPFGQKRLPRRRQDPAPPRCAPTVLLITRLCLRRRIHGQEDKRSGGRTRLIVATGTPRAQTTQSAQRPGASLSELLASGGGGGAPSRESASRRGQFGWWAQ